MRYYKQISDGYILAIGTGLGFDEITEAEYEDIKTAIAAKPPRTETTDYRLRDDLTWDAYEVEPEPDPDLDDAEAWEIIFGGGGE